tara:strand:+ start:448 stop:1503 length:1056 start_codon:yes stop_codon:yes gene_type:complete
VNYLVAPRNYDRDFGGRTPGFGDMDEYGLPRDMSPEDKREVLDRFPLPGGGRGVDPRGPSITPGSNPMGASTEMRGLDEFKKGLDEVNRFMGVYEMLDPRGKQDALKHLLFRPTDNFDITKPVYRPEDKVEVQPLELATNYTTYTDVLPEDIEIRRRIEDVMEEKSPAIKLDPSKLDLREYRQPGPYRPGEDLDKDRFIKSDRSPIASNPETGKRDYLYQYLEQNKEVMGPKNQMFGRYANPDDGTLNNDEMARVDPTDKLLLKSLRKGEIGDPNSPRIRKAIIDLEKKIYNDGRASSMDGALMAADPSFVIPREASPAEVREINRRVISDYEKKKEMLRRGFLSPLLRGV